MLRFQAEPVAVVINAARLTRDAPVQKIARVELQSGFGGVDIQHAPRGRLGHAGRML